MRRTPISRRTPLRSKRPTPRHTRRLPDAPKTQHERRSALLAERKAVRHQKLLTQPFCELRITDVCRDSLCVSTEVHEIVTRARGGSVLDLPNLLALCSDCHRIVTTHPLFAECIGAMLPSWALRENPEPAYLLSAACRQAWQRMRWEMDFQLYWTQATTEEVTASVAAARREAERQ